MEGSFQSKVRAAAVAMWWTVLVAVGVTTVQWLMFLLIMDNRPAWMPALWGGMTWETIQTVAIWMIAVIKVVSWLMLMAAVWLTIWAAKLKHVN